MLSEQSRRQVLIPPHFANGHLVLSEQAIFHYKQSTYYDRARQFTLLWNDPRLGIWWPVATPILSRRDQGCEGAAVGPGSQAARAIVTSGIVVPPQPQVSSLNT